jgi:hypothetical protein
MKLSEWMTAFLFSPRATLKLLVAESKVWSPVVQWEIRGKLVQFWWTSRKQRRRWWEGWPVLFGAEWEENIARSRAEGTALLKQQRWWEHHS